MYKKLLFVLLFGAGGLSLRAQTKAPAQAQTQTQTRRIDTVAVSILDRMSAMIGDLNSCSVTVKSNYDIISHQLGLVKHSDEEQLFMHGPDKLLLRSDGDKGSRDFFFNGKTLSYYSLDKNQYGQIEAPVSLMEMIDTVNKLYGIDFPIADFFYPSFVDDLLAESGNLMYLGLTKVNGKECFHIAGTAKDKTYQFWVTNDAFTLPMKVVIVYTGREMTPQYEAVLSDWQVNPTLPDAMFEFVVPHEARKIKLVPVNTRASVKK